jgi:cysteine desulfurase
VETLSLSEAPIIYLDYHATTPLDPRVLAAMMPYFTTDFANAGSSTHEPGRAAKSAVESARERVAHCLHCDADEIVFTSGATESNNLAIRGTAERPRRKGNQVVSLATEHRAVLDPLARLSRNAIGVNLLPVETQSEARAGRVDLDRFRDALTSDTFLASVMWANNEVGVLQPIREIAEICQAQGVTMHCDATQAVGRIPIDLRQTAVDLMSFSAHKFCGPKGVGALFVRQRPKSVRLAPLLEGGGQEHGLRSGTLNVPGIMGLAAALEIAIAEMQTEQARLAGLRDRLFSLLKNAIPSLELNGPNLTSDVRLAGNLNCFFPGIAGETIMLHTPRIAVSSGSACTSVNPEPSHVLRALGRSNEDARSSLRFGLGRFTTLEEIETAARLIGETVRSFTAASS